MGLRCLLFTSDERTAAPILQALAVLGVEGEHCSNAVATVEKVTHQNFQIVIIDWDQQPEAALLLTAARERKAAERPITLAIVSDDVSVPKALQAGANSILRKPIVVSQAKDTLTTARDLLRSKRESAAVQAAAAGASPGSVSTISASMERGQEKTLRAGEFLHSAPPAPGGQFVTESDVHVSLEPSSVEAVDPLANLEPMAASVAQEKPAPAPPSLAPPSESRGLEWYKKTLAGTVGATPAPAPPVAAPAKPELLGFDQTPSYSPRSRSRLDASARDAKSSLGLQEQKREQKKEAELFAYMAGETSEAEHSSRSGFPLKRAILAALFLAGCAIVIAPQAPWHPKLQAGWVRGRQSLHTWLNPQPVTPVQAPVAHEDFGRAGDEYKLPVAESIPDATTDPSQIQVLPVIDPTIKKPNNEGANALQLPPQGDTPSTTAGDQAPPSEPQVLENHSAPTTPETTPLAPAPIGAGKSASPRSATQAPATSAHSDPFAPPVPSALPRPAPPKNQEPHYASVPGDVPSSLKSHMAPASSAGGNKPPESALPSIEPVTVPEFAERALLAEQPALAYPANAKGQQGQVILQVLIGRDGTVQDAKFLQGSLLFARTAIDGVKLWKFKPYALNGRAVSVQTLLTINFKPAP